MPLQESKRYSQTKNSYLRAIKSNMLWPKVTQILDEVEPDLVVIPGWVDAGGACGAPLGTSVAAVEWSFYRKARKLTGPPLVSARIHQKADR